MHITGDFGITEKAVRKGIVASAVPDFALGIPREADLKMQSELTKLRQSRRGLNTYHEEEERRCSSPFNPDKRALPERRLIIFKLQMTRGPKRKTQVPWRNIPDVGTIPGCVLVLAAVYVIHRLDHELLDARVVRADVSVVDGTATDALHAVLVPVRLRGVVHPRSLPVDVGVFAPKLVLRAEGISVATNSVWVFAFVL